MSHPNPSHDKENEYPSDDYRPKTHKPIAKIIYEKMRQDSKKNYTGMNPVEQKLFLRKDRKVQKSWAKLLNRHEEQQSKYQ